MIMVWGSRIPLLIPGITPGNRVMQIFDSRLYQHGRNSNDDHSLPLEIFSNLEFIQKRLRDGRLIILRELQKSKRLWFVKLMPKTIPEEFSRFFWYSFNSILVSKNWNRSGCNQLGKTERQMNHLIFP
jgi:hypothetical protein